MNRPAHIVAQKKPLYCSFCGKERGDVRYLISSITARICNECIEDCRKVGERELAERNREQSSSIAAPPPQHRPDDNGQGPSK